MIDYDAVIDDIGYLDQLIDDGDEDSCIEKLHVFGVVAEDEFTTKLIMTGNLEDCTSFVETNPTFSGMKTFVQVMEC